MQSLAQGRSRSGAVWGGLYDKVVRGDFQQEDMIATLTTLFGGLDWCFGGWPVRRDGLHGGAAHGGDRRLRRAGRRSRKCVCGMVLGRLFPGGHRIGDRHSRRNRRWQADDAAIVQRKTVDSVDAGLGHIGVRTGSVARVGAARMARCGGGTHGALRKNEGGMEPSLRDVLTKVSPFRVIPAAGYKLSQQ